MFLLRYLNLGLRLLLNNWICYDNFHIKLHKDNHQESSSECREITQQQHDNA